jgi:hypothetical protein
MREPQYLTGFASRHPDILRRSDGMRSFLDSMTVDGRVSALYSIMGSETHIVEMCECDIFCFWSIQLVSIGILIQLV